MYVVGFDQLQLVFHPASLKGVQFMPEMNLMEPVVLLHLSLLHADMLFSFRDTLSIFS